MKPSIKYIVSIALFLANLGAVAQDSLKVVKKDSTQLEIAIPTQLTDTVSANETINLTPNDSASTEPPNFAIYLSLDYGKLITTLAQLETKYEFSVGIKFSKHLRATADFGYAELKPQNAIQNGSYTSLGNYYRLGIEYMHTIAPKTTLSFGGMYATAIFKDEGSVEIQSELWPLFNQSFERPDLTANWAEFVVTSEAAVLNRDSGFFNNLYWGIKFRLRFIISKPTPENFDVYAIPGFGRTFNNVVPAANLFISYKF